MIDRATSGYFRGAHVDRREHVVSLLFFLDSADDFGGPDAGGEFQVFAPRASTSTSNPNSSPAADKTA